MNPLRHCLFLPSSMIASSPTTSVPPFISHSFRLFLPTTFIPEFQSHCHFLASKFILYQHMNTLLMHNTNTYQLHQHPQKKLTKTFHINSTKKIYKFSQCMYHYPHVISLLHASHSHYLNICCYFTFPVTNFPRMFNVNLITPTLLWNSMSYIGYSLLILTNIQY